MKIMLLREIQLYLYFYLSCSYPSVLLYFKLPKRINANTVFEAKTLKD